MRLSRPVCDADLRGGRTAHFGDDPLDGGQVWSSPNAKPDCSATGAGNSSITSAALAAVSVGA